MYHIVVTYGDGDVIINANTNCAAIALDDGEIGFRAMVINDDAPTLRMLELALTVESLKEHILDSDDALYVLYKLKDHFITGHTEINMSAIRRMLEEDNEDDDE